METIVILLGLYMIYSVVHLGILQKKAWCMRSGYEKFVTIFAGISIALVFLGVMVD